MMPKNFSAELIILEFPGSNCNEDCQKAFTTVYGVPLKKVWHEEKTLPPAAGVLIPGGFSFGDHLRAGQLASVSPIVESLRQFAQKGGPILGICNGFQILTESKLLPGVLLFNESGKFSCKTVDLQAAKGSSLYHKSLGGQKIKLPIAHKQGRFYIEPKAYEKILAQEQILLRYTKNPNGSLANIAGLCSSNGRILGLMPHPERAVDSLLGEGEDGKKILNSFLSLCL